MAFVKHRRMIMRTGLALFLVMMTFSSVGARDPWAVLYDFELIPETVVPIDHGFVAALLVEPERDLFAVVIFTVDCDQTECMIKQPAAFSVFDTLGTRVQEFIDPREEPHLLKLAGGVVA